MFSCAFTDVTIEFLSEFGDLPMLTANTSLLTGSIVFYEYQKGDAHADDGWRSSSSSDDNVV